MARDDRGSCEIDPDPVAVVAAATPDVSRIDNVRSGRVQLRDEDVPPTVRGQVEGSGGRREGAGARLARHVDATRVVERHRPRLIRAGTADEGGVDEWVDDQGSRGA